MGLFIKNNKDRNLISASLKYIEGISIYMKEQIIKIGFYIN